MSAPITVSELAAMRDRFYRREIGAKFRAAASAVPLLQRSSVSCSARCMNGCRNDLAPIKIVSNFNPLAFNKHQQASSLQHRGGCTELKNLREVADFGGCEPGRMQRPDRVLQASL